MTLSDDLKLTVGKALGRIPSGLYVATAEHAGQRGAALVSWVQQAAFSPPALTLALAKDRPLLGLIRSAGRLALCLLAEEDTALLKKYARGTSSLEDPFEAVATIRTPGGLIALADALGYLECQVLRLVDFDADHELAIARVTAGAVLKDGKPFVHLRGSGFHY